MPSYQFNAALKVEVEKDIPPSERYLPLGFDDFPNQGKKHYRQFFDDELENVKSVMPSLPFTHIPVLRGVKRKAKDRDAGEYEMREVGSFKGVVKVRNLAEEKEFSEMKERRLTEMKDRL